MIFLQRPPVEAALPDADLRRRYDEWRNTKTTDLRAGTGVITSRWDQFVKGTGKARDVGPVVLAAVREWQHDKCAWCESVEPGTFDHVDPKTKSPARMFDWDNLLACCADCNNVRSHHDIDCEHLIIPTRDEPLQHFRWDSKTGACIFDPSNDRASDTERALAMSRYQGERFQKLRRFRLYLMFLLDDALLDDVPRRVEMLDRLRDELAPNRPYLCILRSWLLHPPNEAERALRDLAFAREPHLLDWVQPWLLPWEGASWPPGR